jgi:cysteinyl-tRNA synthetase
MENKFPHHDCEIAQSEAATGAPFCRYWLHNGMLMIKGEEMHKSLGNFITLRKAFERYPPMAIRFFILGGHYRSPLDLSETALQAAGKGLERLYGTVQAVQERLSRAESGELDEAFASRLAEHKRRFLAGMDDDFNTATAIGVLFDLNKEVNTLLGSEEDISQETLMAINDLYRELGGDILGVIPDEFAKATAGLEEPLIELLIETRQRLREARKWDWADEIRARMTELGIVLEDRPEGARWRISRQ